MVSDGDPCNVIGSLPSTVPRSNNSLPSSCLVSVVGFVYVVNFNISQGFDFLRGNLTSECFPEGSVPLFLA